MRRAAHQGALVCLLYVFGPGATRARGEEISIGGRVLPPADGERVGSTQEREGESDVDDHDDDVCACGTIDSTGEQHEDVNERGVCGG